MKSVNNTLAKKEREERCKGQMEYNASKQSYYVIFC